MKVIGAIILFGSLILLILQKSEVVTIFPNWLINWLIVCSLAIINFSKERHDNHGYEQIRISSMYVSSLTSVCLILSYELI